MKNKRSHVPARKGTTGGDASDFPLPDPLELARLAAMLRPDAPSSPDALKAAVRCYFEAVLFAREQAPAQIKTLLEKWRSVQALKNTHAATWADTVMFDEARELLANPRKLAERQGEVSKEGQPLPKRGDIVETPLHEIPGVVGLKHDQALKRNLLDALAWQIRQLRAPGIEIDEHALQQKLEASFRDSKIPVFLLKAVLRHRYEKRKTSKREYAKKKAVKKNRQSIFAGHGGEKA